VFCVYMSAYCILSVNCVFYVFLQYFDAVGLVFGPVKTVACITYTVLVETLNHAQSIFKGDSWGSCYLFSILLSLY